MSNILISNIAPAGSRIIRIRNNAVSSTIDHQIQESTDTRILRIKDNTTFPTTPTVDRIIRAPSETYNVIIRNNIPAPTQPTIDRVVRVEDRQIIVIRNAGIQGPRGPRGADGWTGTFEGDAIIQGSLTVTGSYVDFTQATGVSGSFSGSFEGDGTGLTNVPGTHQTNELTFTGIGTPVLIESKPTSSFSACHWQYMLVSESNSRTGNLMTNWLNNNIVYADTSTCDIGSTDGTEFSVVSNNGNIELYGTAPIGTVWTLKYNKFSI